MGVEQFVASFSIEGGEYIVKKKSDKRFNIYRSMPGQKPIFISHRDKVKQATKLASMLAGAYNEGYGNAIY